ncbi:MAG: cold shock domain-containing protein [Mobiluncus porci]|uniref:Cold shock domain-containing protein n=1 Tax=Mobiluncus porci TaxID=2652278 RepID=A0A7K0K2S8_9ACTO|nr:MULTISPECIES: cold shock domain-containing protein [Mobiluncus]MCI6585436.1 cold shock domain-containing protein [Mobiluncus sp.]MDD7541354.1 cold shock domain-containing protein [Mobiluncus porci]MDY5747837.1 cold shock domain-containing protein [Mobiluncus porci]MST49719.1 cold shock domain-containing protein [Mobiluncus porci]
MPNGKVKWYDAVKGFGFIAETGGDEVFLHASALPPSVVDIKPGTKVEYSIVEGKRGPQAMNVTIVEQPPSVAKSQRKNTEDMVVIVEDLIRLLEESSGDLRRGHYPDNGKQIAKILKVVAQSFEA